MSIFIQHGYGKGEKIDVVLNNKYASGVIFCPKGETSIDRLKESISLYSQKSSNIYFDSQFHLSLIENAPTTRIEDYPYFEPNRTKNDFASPKKIMSFVESCIDFQIGLDVSGIFTPAYIINSFESDCLAALSLANCSFDYLEEKDITKPVYVSLVIADSAFKGSKQAMDDFITNLTSLEKLNGVYLIIDKADNAYSQQMETEVLQNILYLIYSLANRNDIDVICGYSDIIGLLYLTVGANAIATGWYQSLRYFSRYNYKETTGGSQPRARYTSIPLLNCVLNTPHLTVANDLGLLDCVLSDSSYDYIISGEDGNILSDQWKNNTTAFYHHLECLSKVSKEIETIVDIDDRISFMIEKIVNAQTAYEQLDNVPFEQYTNATHLVQWKDALTALQGMII